MFVLVRVFVLFPVFLIGAGAGSLSAQETGAAPAVGDLLLNPAGRLLFFAAGEFGSLIGIRSLFERDASLFAYTTGKLPTHLQRK
jgi:hypothetical protein